MSHTLVMIPAYNEEETVGTVVTGVRQVSADFEVLVIDDGSTDRTRLEAEKAGAEVVSLPFNSGGLSVILASYRAALFGNYDSLVKIDADGQHKPEDAKRVLEPITANEADICVGSRYLGTMEGGGHDSVTKLVGRAFSSQLVKSVVGTQNLTDTTSGLRAWNKNALRILTDYYLERSRFPDDSIVWPVETIIACRKGLRIREIPIEVLPRLHGNSKSFSFGKMVKYPLKLISLSRA